MGQAMTGRPLPEIPSGMYPIMVVDDRYGGAYSGGAWIAVAKAQQPVSDLDAFDPGIKYRKPTRSEFVLEDGPASGDPEAIKFWAMAPDWVAVGDTPNDAVRNLLNKAICG